jgi:hypothetical protein
MTEDPILRDFASTKAFSDLVSANGTALVVHCGSHIFGRATRDYDLSFIGVNPPNPGFRGYPAYRYDYPSGKTHIDPFQQYVFALLDDLGKGFAERHGEWVMLLTTLVGYRFMTDGDIIYVSPDHRELADLIASEREAISDWAMAAIGRDLGDEIRRWASGDSSFHSKNEFRLCMIYELLAAGGRDDEFLTRIKGWSPLSSEDAARKDGELKGFLDLAAAKEGISEGYPEVFYAKAAAAEKNK